MDSVFFRCAIAVAGAVRASRRERVVGALLHARRQDELHDPLLPARRHRVRSRRQAAAAAPDAASAPTRAGFPTWIAGSTARSSAARTSKSGAGDGGRASGVLRHEELRDASGEATLVAQYEEDGTLEKKTTRSDERRQSATTTSATASLSTRHRTDANHRETYKGSWLRDGKLDEEKTCVYDGEPIVSVTERGRGGVLAFEARREGPRSRARSISPMARRRRRAASSRAMRSSGTWRIFDATARSPRARHRTAVDRPGTDRRGHALGARQGAVRSRAATLPTPDGLAGVDAEPWAETDGCFDENVEAFPRAACAVSSPAIRSCATYCLGAIDARSSTRARPIRRRRA